AACILTHSQGDHPHMESVGPSKPLVIKGTEGLVVNYATCCYPIPGDLIIGRLIAGKGVEIHTEQCAKVVNFRRNPLKCINVQWEEEVQGEFPVCLYVDVLNGRGVLATLANAIAEANANIINVSVDERDGLHNTVKFIVEVRDRAHLARIMRRLRAVQSVTRLIRQRFGTY
ncbi:MAG TPA: ACT domain-containing protein, partial [Gammaproteobacteria bacterium]|nr:ACT domain-containing protein [Gammaproteobacteria bacterium]